MTRPQGDQREAEAPEAFRIMYTPEHTAWVTYNKETTPWKLHAECLGPHSLAWWMHEMYEWGMRVREDMLDLERMLTPEQAAWLLQRKLARGRDADPGDPPPPPPPKGDE